MAASPLKMGGLTPLEIASAVVAGRDSAAFLPEHEPGVSAVAALERLILQALSRPPCLISFSGGRDSSGILARAARVARREGLADPIPVTARFPGVAGADECAWQEHVVSHLDIQDWLRLEFKDELDLVGPVATQLMERQGLFYPWNLHLQSSLIEPARGGSFVTGIGGDEVLAPGSRALSVLAGHSRPRARDALRIALAFAPRSVRCAVLARRRPLHFPWLLPEANDALARSWARELARFPVSWDARLREWWRSRYLQLMLSVLGTL